MEEQLDFIGTSLHPPHLLDQPELTSPRTPIYTHADQHFATLTSSDIDRHVTLWAGLVPTKTEEYFQRYLFAFLSVHTSWEMNVRAYAACRKWYTWINDGEALWTILNTCGVGLTNNRVKFISLFAQAFWDSPSSYLPQTGESWSAARDRIEKIILGLGPAKTSFALELCSPLKADVACFDVHMYRLYGLRQTKESRWYREIEKHWVMMAKLHNVAPFIARAIYWNKRQGQPDCSYWAHVFKGGVS